MDKDVKGFIEWGISEEEKAAAFYKKLAKQTKFDSAQELFKRMSTEEEKHRELLENLDLSTLNLCTLDGLGTLDWVKDLQMTPQSEFGIVKEALKLAIKKEQQAIDSYQKMADSLKDGQYQDLFTRLVCEEQKHKELLKKRI
ncbi:MAG: ferritin family protein [Candidatus Altiarchaeota archaeon]